MTDQEILAKPPEGATHFSWDGHYLKYDLNRVLEIYHVNYKHWQQASTWIGVDRSLADIRRIVELEKDRNVEYIPLDDRQLVYLTVDDLNRIKLEQQAKGLEDLHKLVEKCGAKSLMSFLLIEEADELRAQAKALKEQVKP